MHPHRKLTCQLATRKARVLTGIADRREGLAATVDQVLRPVARVDQALEYWRQLPPWVKIVALPLAFVVTRKMLGRWTLAGQLVRWIPLGFTVANRLRP